MMINNDLTRINRFKDIASKTLNYEVNLVRWNGSTDLKYFSAKGTPSIVFGPWGTNHHAEQEYLDINSLHLCLRVIEEYIREEIILPEEQEKEKKKEEKAKKEKVNLSTLHPEGGAFTYVLESCEDIPRSDASPSVDGVRQI
jgi:hypothetical protein